MQNTEQGSDLALCPLFHTVKPADRSRIAYQGGPVLKHTVEGQRSVCQRVEGSGGTGKAWAVTALSESQTIKLGKGSEVSGRPSSLPDPLRILGQ